MVSTLAQAIAWGVSGLLGVRHDDPVAHRELEHAHWDPVARAWFTHEESVAAREREERDRLSVGAAVGVAEGDPCAVGDRSAG